MKYIKKGMRAWIKKYKLTADDRQPLPMDNAIGFGMSLMTNRPQGIEDTKKIYGILSKCGCKDIILLNDEHGADTVYFEVTRETKMADLLGSMNDLRPDEINQVTKNCFRLWWD